MEERNVKDAYEKKWAKTETVGVDVITETYRIEGTLHKTSHIRLSDEMNIRKGDYLPLSDVVVYATLDNREISRKKFLLVKKEHIIMMTEKTV